MNQIHDFQTCTCCGDLLLRGLSRRRLLRVAGGVAAFATLQPFTALAASGNYDAMVLSCIDPRFQEPVTKYTAAQGLTGKYSQFTFAGAAIGVVAPAFKDWHKAFWDNLATSVALHHIGKVIAIDHRDCGAAKIAYGEAKVANREIETETHRAALAEFRRQVGQHQPKLAVETGLMAIDGTIEMIG
jgi:carbonic anhydrase